ncbi:MAG: hypothetical protein HY550_02785 [Elusimicrobia bacterium]|nr:hypothetical protein [Elusimicrobiota bacterium]
MMTRKISPNGRDQPASARLPQSDRSDGGLLMVIQLSFRYQRGGDAADDAAANDETRKDPILRACFILGPVRVKQKRSREQDAQ